jgi:hypothetical protein
MLLLQRVLQTALAYLLPVRQHPPRTNRVMLGIPVWSTADDIHGGCTSKFSLSISTGIFIFHVCEPLGDPINIVELKYN